MKLWMKLLTATCTLFLPCLSHADFKLSDFAGSYASYSSSAGGVTVPDPANGSTTSISQFTLDKCGKGVVNYANVTVFFHPNHITLQTLAHLPIQFTLTHPSIGVGQLTFFDYPIVGSSLETNFVATKKTGKHGKRVSDLFLNVTGFTGQTPGVLRSPSVIIAQRQ